MRKFIAAAIVAFAFATPSAAQAAITLDPGTRLTVVCEQPRPFSTRPFSVPEQDWAYRSREGRRLEITLGHFGPDTNEFDNPAAHLDAIVVVRRLGSDQFRIAVRRESVRWRGCH